jgi:hypothetical protein
VATARTSIRRRRAVHTTWIGTSAALVGVLTVMVAGVGGNHTTATASLPVTGANTGPIIDDRARTLDQELNQVKGAVIPAGMTVTPTPITVDGRKLGFEFTTSGDTSLATLSPPSRAGQPPTVAMVIGSGYDAGAKLSDSQGWGSVDISVLHKNSASTTQLGTCATLPPDNCQSTTFPDGTKAAVSSGEAPLGYPNSGTNIEMDALRPDGTYIRIICTNLDTPGGASVVPPITQPTRPQPPLTPAELLQFATAFTY